MNGDRKFRIYELEYLPVDGFAFRFKLFKMRLKVIYRNIKFLFAQIKLFKVMLTCHWIAFLHWILTGEIMQEYLDLLEDQRNG